MVEQNRQVEPLRDPLLERPLPSSPDTERAFLGSIMLDNALMAEAVVEVAKLEYFYIPSHRRIYSAMLALFEKGSEINPVLVAEELRRNNELESSGGLMFLTNLTNLLPHVQSVSAYAKILRGKYILRQLVKAANLIMSEALEDEGEPEEVLDRSHSLIFSVSENVVRTRLKPVKQLAEGVLERAEAVEGGPGGQQMISGVPTGFRGFDTLTAGLQRQDLIIIAARPSMGKTSLALSLAQHAAIRAGMVVGVFSLEMSEEEIALRILCSEADVSSFRLKQGYCTNEEWSRLGRSLSAISDAKLFVDDTPAISVMEMKAKAMRLATEQKKLDMIVVDYLQLMSGGSGRRRYESRQQEVSQISRELKGLAKELKIPMVALSQLSRGPENRTDHRPHLADLRESGAIEQDADVVAFIYREEEYKKTDENAGIAELIVAKQRNGPTDTAYLAFIKHYAKFADLDRDALGAYLSRNSNGGYRRGGRSD